MGETPDCVGSFFVFFLRSDNLSIIHSYVLIVWLEHSNVCMCQKWISQRTFLNDFLITEGVFFFSSDRKNVFITGVCSCRQPLCTRLSLRIQCQTRSTPSESLCTQRRCVKGQVDFENESHMTCTCLYVMIKYSCSRCIFTCCSRGIWCSQALMMTSVLEQTFLQVRSVTVVIDKGVKCQNTLSYSYSFTWFKLL